MFILGTISTPSIFEIILIVLKTRILQYNKKLRVLQQAILTSFASPLTPL